jgi:hypothetical protein
MVGEILDGLKRGVPVATNLDLKVEHLLSGKKSARLYRLPDFPVAEDLEMLGRGCESRNEDDFGMIVLDEVRMFLGSRSWNEKGRDRLINWLLHARKLGWHCYFIAQDVTMIDKQVRTALVEHLVRCKRLDRLKIPVFGSILRLLGQKGVFPRIHIGVVKYGLDQNAPVVDRWIYQGDHLFAAYDTQQVFSGEVYSHGVSCYLTPDRYQWFRFPRHKLCHVWCDRLPKSFRFFLKQFLPPFEGAWHPSEVAALAGLHKTEIA